MSWGNNLHCGASLSRYSKRARPPLLVEPNSLALEQTPSPAFTREAFVIHTPTHVTSMHEASGACAAFYILHLYLVVRLC